MAMMAARNSMAERIAVRGAAAVVNFDRLTVQVAQEFDTP
jgi:hypothetical protein